MNPRKKTLMVLSLLLCALTTSAEPYDTVMGEVKVLLKSVGAGMAVVLISYYAINWITADNPQARMDARNSIKWILIGLLILVLAYGLTCGILGYAVRNYYDVEGDFCL